MSNWQKVRLGDILNFKRGHDLPKYNMEEGDIPVAGSNGIIGYHNVATNISPCITIGRSGNVGTPYMYERCWAHNTVLYIDDYKGNNPKYLYYLLETLNLGNYGGGSAVPTLNRNHIHPIDIFYTSDLAEQERIARILGALDDKIECNNRINRNLEEQAAALFRRWFVDFEFPDSNGSPYRSAGGTMQDSPLGSIPQGWQVVTLGDIGAIAGGGTPSRANEEYFTSNGIAWITPKDLSISKNKFTAKGETDITDLGYKNSSTKIIPKGSVLFSSRAPIGYISIAKNELCTNQGFKSVTPSDNIGTPYIYYFLKTNVESIESKASGSTFKEASGALMKSLEVLIPANKTLKSFNDICNAMFDQQEKLEEENRTLSELRDSLLPKLMNNQI